MAKTFHGCIEDTLDALIIFEACRQGVLPRIHRRLLEAERGDSNLPTLATMDRSTPAHSTQTLLATAATAGPSEAPTKPERPSSSLITPGSVFVFDEDESGIRRWTDGRIWSPSRICGNFLVYRELFRKLNSEKCLNPKEKARMSDGSGLQDKALREKVEKDNLIVLGCMKGTFVLKRDGLIKKTICVRGVRLPPLDELRKSDRSSSSRAPRYSSTGMQHLVCYEKPGAMASLHRPRAYAELLDLPLSKTFIMMQKYREPIYITPLCIDAKPIEPSDEYVSSSRVSRVRDAPKELTSSARRKRLRSLDVIGHSNQQESGSSFRDSDPGTMLLSSNKTTAITRHSYPTRSRDRQPLMAEQTLTLAAFSAAHTPESRWSRDLSRSLTATEDLSEVSMEDVRESSAELHPNDSLTVRGHKSEDGNWQLIPASILPYMDLSAYRTQSPTSTGYSLEHEYRPEQPSHPDASGGDPESCYFSSKPLSPHGHCAFKSQRLEPKQDRGESVSTGKNLLQLSESGRRWTARNDESQDQADEIHRSLKSASPEPWGGETEEYSLSAASSLSLHAEWSTGSLSSQGSPSPSLSLSPAGNQANNRVSGYSLPESSTPSGQLAYSECRETTSSVYKYPNVPSEIVSPLFTTSSREMYMANDLPEYQGTQGHDLASITEYESSTSGCRVKPHCRVTTHQSHSTSSQAQHGFSYPTERPQFDSRADTVSVAAGSISSRMLQSLPLVRMHAVSSAGSSLASHVLATPSVRPYPTGGVPLAVAFQPNSEEEGPWGCGTTLIETASLTPANVPRFSHIGSMSKNYQEQQYSQASDPLAQRIARVHSIFPVALQDGYSVLGVKQELDNGTFLSNSSLRDPNDQTHTIGTYMTSNGTAVQDSDFFSSREQDDTASREYCFTTPPTDRPFSTNTGLFVHNGGSMDGTCRKIDSGGLEAERLGAEMLKQADGLYQHRTQPWPFDTVCQQGPIQGKESQSSYLAQGGHPSSISLPHQQQKVLDVQLLRDTSPRIQFHSPSSYLFPARASHAGARTLGCPTSCRAAPATGHQPLNFSEPAVCKKGSYSQSEFAYSCYDASTTSPTSNLSSSPPDYDGYDKRRQNLTLEQDSGLDGHDIYFRKFLPGDELSDLSDIVSPRDEEKIADYLSKSYTTSAGRMCLLHQIEDNHAESCVESQDIDHVGSSESLGQDEYLLHVHPTQISQISTEARYNDSDCGGPCSPSIGPLSQDLPSAMCPQEDDVHDAMAFLLEQRPETVFEPLSDSQQFSDPHEHSLFRE